MSCAVRRQAGARGAAAQHGRRRRIAGSSNPGSANHERPLHAETLRRSVPAACLEALRARFGDRFSESAAVREHHGRDESPYPVMAPDGVVFAHSTEEVAEIARLCNEHRVPLIPYGAGSSLEGHILAIQGGISLDLSQMNKVLAVNAEDLTATVPALRKQLNEEIRGTGLFFPIDPGADASLGGMAATRASGTNAVRYGTMRENVMSLTVVTADGRMRTAGAPASPPPATT